MSRANTEEQTLLDEILGSNRHYDPDDKDQRERFIKAFNIEIVEEKGSEKFPFSGWSVLWKHGGGLVCPPMPEDDARTVIALACYLDLCGVDVSLTNRMAYWYIRGPKLVVTRKRS